MMPYQFIPENLTVGLIPNLEKLHPSSFLAQM